MDGSTIIDAIAEATKSGKPLWIHSTIRTPSVQSLPGNGNLDVGSSDEVFRINAISPRDETGLTIGVDAAKLAGFHGSRVDQAAAMTAQLTTITPADAEGTPDYEIAAVTNVAPYGFSAAQEVITLLYVVKNLQVRVAELEAMLNASTGKGICA